MAGVNKYPLFVTVQRHHIRLVIGLPMGNGTRRRPRLRICGSSEAALLNSRGLDFLA